MLDVPDRRYGLADPKALAAMTGRQVLEAIMTGELPAPPMARTLDFTLVRVGDGSAAFEGEPGEAFLNPMGAVHGGWALTLVDSAAGCAGMTLLPAGGLYTTIETKVNFARPITTGTGRVRRGDDRRPRPADPFRRGARHRRQGTGAGARHLDADGAERGRGRDMRLAGRSPSRDGSAEPCRGSRSRSLILPSASTRTSLPSIGLGAGGPERPGEPDDVVVSARLGFSANRNAGNRSWTPAIKASIASRPSTRDLRIAIGGRSGPVGGELSLRAAARRSFQTAM